MNHASMQLLERWCLPVPANSLVALQIEETLPQPMLCICCLWLLNTSWPSFLTADVAPVSPRAGHTKEGDTLLPLLLPAWPGIAFCAGAVKEETL